MKEKDRYCPPNCPKRVPGCHSSCERYKEKCAENEKRKAYLQKNDVIYDYRSRSMYKAYMHRKHDRKLSQNAE